jgi:hypothetical protein
LQWPSMQIPVGVIPRQQAILLQVSRAGDV